MTKSITRAHVNLAPARGLFVFQTPSQFLFVATSVAVLYVVLSWLPGLNAGVRSGALTGGLFAMLTWLVFVLPATFEWRLTGPNTRVAAQERIGQVLKAIGYREEFQPLRFRPALPRWARGDWNVISVQRLETSLVVTGPWMVIRKIRRQVLDDASKS
jgi:hypothetical protein